MKNIVVEMIKKVFDPKCRIEKTQINDNEYVIKQNGDFNENYTEKYYKNKVLYKKKIINDYGYELYEVDNNGIRNGFYVYEITDLSGIIKKRCCHYKNGKLDGDFREYFNDVLVQISKFKMDRTHGLYQYNHPFRNTTIFYCYQNNKKGFGLMKN